VRISFWIFSLLSSLQNEAVDVDIDEILDMDTDDIRRSFLFVSSPCCDALFSMFADRCWSLQSLISTSSCKRSEKDISVSRDVMSSVNLSSRPLLSPLLVDRNSSPISWIAPRRFELMSKLTFKEGAISLSSRHKKKTFFSDNFVPPQHSTRQKFIM
jgi:hypothetical protein